MSISNVTPVNLFLRQLFSSKPLNNVHISIDTHLTADLFATSLIIDAGITLFTDNYSVFVLTHFVNNGTISNSGRNGGNGTALSGGAAGTVPADGTWQKSGAGGIGKFNGQNGASGGAVSKSLGEQGGNGGDAGIFTSPLPGACTRMTVSSELLLNTLSLTNIPYILNPPIFTVRGGSGGSSGAADLGSAGSGGGGAGGGILFVAANIISGSGLFAANGGNGGNAFDDGVTPAGGGGAGGSGVVFLFYTSFSGPTISNNYGTAGLGKRGGGDGSDPNTGFPTPQYLP